MMTAHTKNSYNIMVYIRDVLASTPLLQKLLEERLELSETPYVVFTVLAHYPKDFVAVKKVIENVLGEGVHYDIIHYRVTGWGETGGIFHFMEVAKLYYPQVVITDSPHFAEFVESRRPLTIKPRVVVYLLKGE